MQRYLPCLSCYSLNRVASERLDQGPICGKCKKTLSGGSVFAVDHKGLQSLIQSSPLLVIVDVWAPWCGPCLRFAPIFQEYAQQHLEQALFLKLDSETHQSAAQAYRIQSIPTLLAFRGGKEVARQSGLMQTAQLGQWIQAIATREN